jgi:putative membrane protein
MKKIVNGLIGLIALEHIWFLVVEMFLWTRPIGMKMFALELNFAQQTTAMAANQGLYNGFLAAGLIWSLLSKTKRTGLKVFFLSCVVIAGVFGAATVSSTILIVQAGPALLALIFVYLSQMLPAHSDAKCSTR